MFFRSKEKLKHMEELGKKRWQIFKMGLEEWVWVSDEK